MKEIWKDIKGYEGLYQVSNLGRVKSLGRKINTGRNGYRVTTDMILKQHITRGYARVILQKPSGKVYKTKAGAQRQARAIYASGYKGK